MESFEVGSPDLSLIGGDTDTIVTICDLFILVDTISHTECMRLIHTKHYGFLHLADLFDDRLRDEIRPLMCYDALLEITGDVGSLGGRSLEDMVSAREGEFIDIELDTLDLERSEESIIDPTSKRIFIDRLAKIVIGIDIVISLRSRSETEMYST